MTRIQRKRSRGWRAPQGAIYVGRGSRWGNPYTIQRSGPDHTVVDSRTGTTIYTTQDQVEAHRVAVDWYRAWLTSQPSLQTAARRQLAGRTLMCWCPPELPCHADVLLELTSQPGQAVAA